MGNALYRRLATRADATGATVEPIPCSSSNGTFHAGATSGGGPTHAGAFDRLHPHARRRNRYANAYYSGGADDGAYDAPQFRHVHRAVGTEDDPDAPFYAIAQHQLLRHANLIQIQSCLFTLAMWNYLNMIRFVFGQDDYGDSVPENVYIAWMLTGTIADDTRAVDPYLPTASKRWIGLAYLAACVGGIVTTALLTLYMLWENRSAAFHVSKNADADEVREQGERVYLNRPLFVYTRRTQHKGIAVSGSEAYRFLDVHAEFHSEYGDDARGDVAPYLMYVPYLFALVIAIIDVGIVGDLTVNGSSSSAGSNSTASTSSYGASKVGSGVSVLQAIVTIASFMYVIVVPRMWYQKWAEGYLAARYY